MDHGQTPITIAHLDHSSQVSQKSVILLKKDARITVRHLAQFTNMLLSQVREEAFET